MARVSALSRTRAVLASSWSPAAAARDLWSPATAARAIGRRLRRRKLLAGLCHGEVLHCCHVEQLKSQISCMLCEIAHVPWLSDDVTFCLTDSELC